MAMASGQSQDQGQDGPSTLTTTLSTLPPFSDPTPTHRLFGPTPELVFKSGSISFIGGLLVGYRNGARMAGLRFRAEHAHKMPRSTKELYFYHRRKNYYVAKYGIEKGIATGARLAGWTGVYFIAEGAIDAVRGERRDFVSSMTAGVGVAGLFSLINRFNLVETARTARIGLVAGLAYGLMQDALATAKGRRFRYMDFILRRPREGN